MLPRHGVPFRLTVLYGLVTVSFVWSTAVQALIAFLMLSKRLSPFLFGRLGRKIQYCTYRFPELLSPALNDSIGPLLWQGLELHCQENFYLWLKEARKGDRLDHSRRGIVRGSFNSFALISYAPRLNEALYCQPAIIQYTFHRLRVATLQRRKKIFAQNAYLAL
jgi:hypothetical protein